MSGYFWFVAGWIVGWLMSGIIIYSLVFKKNGIWRKAYNLGHEHGQALVNRPTSTSGPSHD